MRFQSFKIRRTQVSNVGLVVPVQGLAILGVTTVSIAKGEKRMLQKMVR
jgi:hypothetical protein